MQERDALSKVLSEPLPSSDGPPNSIGARLAAAQAASRAAQAEARLIDLTHAHGKAQVCVLVLKLQPYLPCS